ncbi:hypothetical protein OHS33_36160 [Streptomyces sp. NBC_00536]|uniref:hypothetical protein n=1 Tax=Streptomyces sp. NBC_00536 TaxID=2975769 RepID=UPI002E813C2E|nr:hypothetical protein [Streptomyces sp. NBC_00536]WUC83338.1 hypothetical protein OHS33_36160 [Streptomyces sp. NBC_00536]
MCRQSATVCLIESPSRGALDRRIELADLTIADVDVEDSGIDLWIAYSKTYKAAGGESTFISAETGTPRYDPVAAVRDRLNCLHRMGVHEGAIRTRPHLPGAAAEPGHGNEARRPRERRRPQRLGPPPRHLPRPTARRRPGDRRRGRDPTQRGRWKPGSSTVKREYLDHAQSRAQHPWHQVQAARRGASGDAS